MPLTLGQSAKSKQAQLSQRNPDETSSRVLDSVHLLDSPSPKIGGQAPQQPSENRYIFVPNPQQLPVIVRGPVTISPTNNLDTILSRETSAPGRYFYRVRRRVGQRLAHVINVRQEDILEHVSAAELEQFETMYVREQEQSEQDARRRGRGRPPKNRDVSLADSADELGVEGPLELSADGSRGLSDGRKRKATQQALTGMVAATPKRRSKAKSKARKSSSASSDDERFEVEAIVDDASVDGRREYLVKWVGYSEEDNTWLPEEDLHAPKLLRQYLKAKENDYEIEALVNDEYVNGVRKFEVQWAGYPGQNTWEPENELPADMVKDYVCAKTVLPVLMHGREPSDDL